MLCEAGLPDKAGLPERVVEGRTEVVVEGSVRLDSDIRSLHFIRFLREASAAEVGVTWSAEKLSGIDVSLFVHLPPPVDWTAGAAEHAAQWRNAYRYGSCYYRRGPGFTTVKDTRLDVEGSRFVIDDVRALAAFPELLGVADLDAAGASVRELVQVLVPERLVLRFGDAATLLPVRMRRWPVPCDAI